LNFDVFNGDADGICALQQLRLKEPVESTLITGVKRDIKLLSQISTQPGDSIIVLDISLDKNKEALSELLQKGAFVKYFDHHYAGDIPEHENLSCYINTNSEICTSLIVNEFLQGEFVLWAIVGAYGDNMIKIADSYAVREHLSKEQSGLLRELGTLLNYNGYGSTINDLYFNPSELYRVVSQYKTPFDFITSENVFKTLREGYALDMEEVSKIQPELSSGEFALYILPDKPYSRRVSGVFGNQLAEKSPERAHAILSQLSSGDYLVSVRAPLINRTGADELCRQFPTGGGRKAAAGINNLKSEQLSEFIECFKRQFSEHWS